MNDSLNDDIGIELDTDPVVQLKYIAAAKSILDRYGYLDAVVG